jgi:D-alanyl-lipoteichoic acid acyltransferase DltB (MBOAT superfamily)
MFFNSLDFAIFLTLCVSVYYALGLALYVAFFPQLAAGPIERAATFLPQILGNRSVTQDKFTSGSWLIFWGLFKRVVIAEPPIYPGEPASAGGRGAGE